MKKVIKIIAAVALSVTALHFTFRVLPYPELERFLNRDYSVRIYDRKNQLIQITSLANGLRREFVPSAEIPSKVKNSFITAEDSRFFFHPGLDPFAVVRALFQNVVNKKNVSGASTITMQLAKIIQISDSNQGNDFSSIMSRGMKNKIQDAVNALKLEARFSKNEILELYLNSIPFGNNVEGILSASRLYFGKDVSSLSDDEIKVLAMIPRRPVYYSPSDKFDFPYYMPHLVRYLDSNGYFSKSGSVQLKTYKSKKPYEVHLSADLKLQDFVQQEAFLAMDEVSANRISNISILVMDVQSGNVLSWVGSNSFLDNDNGGQIDGVRFYNQPGSSVKPFLYALALDKEIVLPTDIMADVPMEFGGSKIYIPFNFNNRFNGPVSLRVCLASSLNVPAVDILNRIGIRMFTDKMEELGFKDFSRQSDEMNLGLALGAGSVSLEDFVPAFSVFARDGKYIPLGFFEDESSDKKEERQVFSQDTARIIANFLSEKNARALGFGSSQSFETKYPSIFKTGTSNQFQNITALGATPRYAVGVWMGNFSGETVMGKTGSSVPAKVARKILDYLEFYDDKESLSFPEPVEYEKREVCQLSGLKKTEACVSAVSEYVRKDIAIPECSWHSRENGKVVVHYPEVYQNYLLMNKNVYSPDDFKISYKNSELEIISPQNNSVFYYDSKFKGLQAFLLEIQGGTSDKCEILIDDVPYAVIKRPFVQRIEVRKGSHVIKVICGNQQNSVCYEVK